MSHQELDKTFVCDDYVLLCGAVGRLDTDDTGYISIDNLRNVLGDDFTADKADDMLREADRKGDGLIDYDEFLSLFRDETQQMIKSGVQQLPPRASEFGRAAHRFLGPAMEETGSVVLEGGPSRHSRHPSMTSTLSVETSRGPSDDGSISPRDGDHSYESETSIADIRLEDGEAAVASQMAPHATATATAMAEASSADQSSATARPQSSDRASTATASGSTVTNNTAGSGNTAPVVADAKRYARVHDRVRAHSPSPLRQERRFVGKHVVAEHHPASEHPNADGARDGGSSSGASGTASTTPTAGRSDATNGGVAQVQHMRPTEQVSVSTSLPMEAVR